MSKPVVLVSRCLGFDRCRYDGAAIEAPLVANLKSFTKIITVCPELEIGLGVPRDPIRIIQQKSIMSLVQPATGRDLTAKMAAFCARVMNSLPAIDGVVLKSRSPSCGINDARIYSSAATINAAARGAGFFGRAVLDRFPCLPIEDEGRLLDLRIREHFLTRLFINARWRTVAGRRKIKDLVRFHSENKLMYMSYRGSGLRALDRIVANPEKKPVEDVFLKYRENLLWTMARVPKPSTSINVLMHALGCFSEDLSAREKKFFLDTLGKYRRGRVPLNVCREIMNSWITRFDEKSLAQQTFFTPYPEKLVEMSD